MRYLPRHHLHPVRPKVGRRVFLRNELPALRATCCAAASGGRTLGTPRARPRRARARALNFPGGGRSPTAGLSLARLLPSLGDREEVPAARWLERCPRRHRNTGTGRANLEPRGRARTTPQRRRRAHPGLSPQAAIRQGQATPPPAPKPDQWFVSAPGTWRLCGLEAAEATTGRSGWGQAGVRAAAPLRARTAPGTRRRTKLPGPRLAVGGPRTCPRHCARPGDAAVVAEASLRPGCSEPGGRRGRGGADPSAPAQPHEPAPPSCSSFRPPPAPRRLRAQPPNSQRPSQVYLVRNSPRRTRQRRTGSPRSACWGRRRTAGTGVPPLGRFPSPPRAPSPCSGAPSGGGSSSSDLRCWGLACLRRDMLLAARGPGAGQRHQRGGRRGRRGARMGPSN